MDKVVARRLRPYEGRKLQRLKRQLSNAVNSRRARVILLSRGGFRNREIAERVGLSPQWVREIIHRFNDAGIDGITWYPYFCCCGGPRQFTADVVERISEVALSPPRQLIGMSVWSLAKLRDYLVEQEIVASISLEWLRQILRSHGLRWRRTKTWKESNDPEFWPKYRRIRRLYDRPPPGGVRLCIDEFGPLNLLPRHGKHYARTGHVDRLSERPTDARRACVTSWASTTSIETRSLATSSRRRTAAPSCRSFGGCGDDIAIAARSPWCSTTQRSIHVPRFWRMLEPTPSASTGRRRTLRGSTESSVTSPRCRSSPLTTPTTGATTKCRPRFSTTWLGGTTAVRSAHRTGSPTVEGEPHEPYHGRETLSLETALVLARHPNIAAPLNHCDSRSRMRWEPPQTSSRHS